MTKVKKNLTDCPKCKAVDSVRAEATVDFIPQYLKDENNNGYFTYESDGNEPTVTGFYCFECGETFTLEDIENQAIKIGL